MSIASVYTNKDELRSRRSATGPFLTADHRRQHLQFTDEHVDWDLEELSVVLFTDESSCGEGLVCVLLQLICH